MSIIKHQIPKPIISNDPLLHQRMAMLSSEEKKNTNDNGVIIKYYVESVKNRPMKKTKPNEYLRYEEKHGFEYDRRANLLAHSRYLRNPASETVTLPVIQSRPKPKSKVNYFLYFLL